MKTNGSNMPRRLIWVLDNPVKSLLMVLLGMLFITSFMRFVQPSVSYKDMLGAEHPKLLVYEAIQREFSNDDNALLLVEAKAGNVFSKQILTVVRELTELLWKTPYSIRVDSISNYQHTEAVGDDLTVTDLVAVGALLDDKEIKRIKAIAMSEPSLLNRAVNPQANVLGVNINFAFPNERTGEKIEAVEYLNHVSAELESKHPEIKIHVAGLVPLDATVMQISQKETGLFLGLLLLIVIVLLSLLLKSFTSVAASLLVFVFSVIAGIAFSGIMGWKLTPFTASVPMIIIILAVADCVHFLTDFVAAMRAGESKRSALESSMRLNYRPILITSVTTAIGFLSLNFSESESIGALGSQVAFGVMIAFVLSMTLLPALISILPVRIKPKPKSGRNITAHLVGFLYRAKLPLLGMASFILILSGYGISLNEFNDELPKYFSTSLPWRQANDFSEQQFGGAYTFSYKLESGRSDGVTDPEYLAKVDEFTHWLRALPEAVYVNSVTDTFKRLNMNLHGDDLSAYQLPESRELAAQYLLLYEMSLPYGLDLNNQINLKKSAVKVLVTFKTLKTDEVLAMETKINRWLANNLKGIEATGSGVQIMFAHLLNNDTKGLFFGAGMSLLLISMLLIYAFRSVRMGLISLLPNLFPALIAFGVWGLLVGQIGMGLSMVSGMTIGIIVDDTIHFISKYLVARREKSLSAQASVEYALQSVGVAIIFTSIVLITGFMVMALLADFRLNSDMGKMTAMVIFMALVFDLVVLPVVLMVFDKDKKSRVVDGQVVVSSGVA